MDVIAHLLSFLKPFSYFVVYSRNADAEFYYSEGITTHTLNSCHNTVVQTTSENYRYVSKGKTQQQSEILYLVTLTIIMSNSNSHKVHEFDLYIKPTDAVHFASQCF